MSAIPAFVDLAIVAEILCELADDVETLGVTLCHDTEFAARHLEALQAIDQIAQKQRSLAGLLESENTALALEALGLEELKQRLGAAATRNYGIR